MDNMIDIAPGQSIIDPEAKEIPKFTQRRDIEPSEWEHERVTDFATGPVEYYINDVRVTTDQFFRTLKEFNLIKNDSGEVADAI